MINKNIQTYFVDSNSRLCDNKYFQREGTQKKLLPELPATPGKIQVECSSLSRIETKNQLIK